MMTADTFHLKDKVAIVTGSTKGMGRAIVERFAADGARVVVSSRNADEAAAVAAELNGRYGKGRVVAVSRRCVIEDKADLQAVVELAVDSFGKVTTLVCCASALPWLGPSREMPDEAVDFQFLSVFKSKFWLSNMCIPSMIESGGGSIIYISSGSTHEATSERSVYACMRAAELQLMKNIAAEFGAQNIRINAIWPGLIRTFSSEPLFKNASAAQTAAARAPMRRNGEPEEIAQATAFPASDASSFTTGAVIPVDGGRSIHATQSMLTPVYGGGLTEQALQEAAKGS
jgi:NAD(P)-dependent dehydrogenase (short-subunit alcohol dehydrogenase family)